MEKEPFEISIKRFKIGDIVAFLQLDTQTVVERADGRPGPGNYMVKKNANTAIPAIKDKNGNFIIQPKGELIIFPDKLMKVVGYLAQ